MGTSLPTGRYYGVSQSSRHTGGIRLTESAYRVGVKLPPHSHQQGLFVLVLSGKYRETVGGQSRERHGGELFYLPANVMHQEEHLVTGRRFMIEPDACLAEEMASLQINQGEPIDLPAESARVARQIYAEFCNFDGASRMVIKGHAALMIGLFKRSRLTHADQVPRPISLAQGILRQRFKDAPSMQQLASEVGLDRVHLMKVFKRHMGVTPDQYLRDLRLEYACQQLVDTSKTCFEIAHDAGFYDPSHFTHRFRLVYGTTPVQFRQNARRSVQAQ